MSTDPPTDGPTDAQTACFEAGVKFGSLYHQFVGTPVSPGSAASLEAAMEEAIENQPHCEAVRVAIDRGRVREATDHEHGYTELTGALMEVEIDVVSEGVSVATRMDLVDGYPLMRVVDVD